MLDQMSDPDYFYHVALSKQIMMSGFPETVPQPTDIGWNILFSDKEYLYHVITTFFYTYFGEAGVRATSLIFLAISSLTLLYHSLKTLGARLFLFPLLILALDPHFLRRMIMVRPQTLAVMLFIFIVLGFITKRKYMILVASFLFTLSYHGLQVPGILIAASLFTSIVSQPHHARLGLFCALGLIAGVLLHPYFPGNLSFLSQIINIVRDTTDASTLSYGTEIYPWKTSEYLKYSLILGVVFALAMSTIGHLSDSQRDDDRSEYSIMMFLTVSFCLFLAVSFLTPRGREYLVPTGIFLAIQVLRNTPITATVLITVMSCAQAFALRDSFDLIMPESRQKTLAEIFQTLDGIPKDEKAHILNCNWSHAPYIMYHRPNMTFVDLLDPSFLQLANKPLHEARADLMNGRSPDLYFTINDVFKAKYLLCDSTPLNLTVDNDPHFERLYPTTPISISTQPLALFKVKESSPLPQYEREFEYSLPKARDVWTPIVATFKTAKQELPTTYVNFLNHITKENLTESHKESSERVANCVFIRPKDISRHVGANFIGLGSGPNIRLWINDEPAFENVGEPERQKSIDVLVPLAKPLKSTDTVQAMICPGVTQSYFGFTMSFWSEAQVTQLCAAEMATTSSETVDSAATPLWKFKGTQKKTCLGPIAANTASVAPADPEPAKKVKGKRN